MDLKTALDNGCLIGMMHFNVKDPSKSYITGASEEENEEFRKYAKSIFREGRIKDYVEDAPLALDCAEGIKRIDHITSENYNDIMNVKGMPKSCLGGEYGEKLRQKMSDLMRNYYSGELSQEELRQKIKNICMDMRVEQVQQRHTNGYNARDNKQILEDIYTLAQKTNVNSAVNACLQEGKEKAQQMGNMGNDGWMYYDAKYYYKEEELRDVIEQTIFSMGEEWETDPLDFAGAEKNSGYKIAGGFEFNDVWQWQALQRRITCLTDIEAVPPEDFSFFYQERKYSEFDNSDLEKSQKGYVEVGYKGQTYKADVPFDGYNDRNKDFFQMKDFQEKYFGENMEEICRAFLGKFNIFTEMWASTKGDNMWIFRV